MSAPLAGETKRIIFFGTPDIAVNTLTALHQSGFEVVLVVTRPDRRRGRGKAQEPNAVKKEAHRLGLTVSSHQGDALTCDADLGVVVAYGEMITKPVLGHLPMVNLHFSLLPRWRGAAPVERAILSGDEFSGVCLMEVTEKLDEGGIYGCVKTPIADNENSQKLATRLSNLGNQLLIQSLEQGFQRAEPQHGQATYAKKLTTSDRRINWNESAKAIQRQVRAGGAWTTFREQRLKVWRSSVADPEVADVKTVPPGTICGNLVATSAGWLELLEVQAEGRSRQNADAWLNGIRLRGSDLMR